MGRPRWEKVTESIYRLEDGPLWVFVIHLKLGPWVGIVQPEAGKDEGGLTRWGPSRMDVTTHYETVEEAQEATVEWLYGVRRQLNLWSDR